LDTYNTLVVLDMLVRLNMEEGISLVMVTHDPSVKNLATCVVHIRDGKIHGKEDIEHAERVEQMEKIRSDLRAQDGVHWLLGGIDGEEKASAFTDKTEIRQPEEYIAYEAMEKVVGERDMFQDDMSVHEESEGEAATPEEKEAQRIRKEVMHDGAHFGGTGQRMEDE
jgi:ABC-type methionine transport system ATPase subunit